MVLEKIHIWHAQTFVPVRERIYSTMGEGERLGLSLTADVEGLGCFEKKKFEKKYYFFFN